MRAKNGFLQLLIFFILIISASAFSQPADLKIEYYDFIYAYSGDYVNIVGKLTNTGDINYKDISITVKLYDKDNRLISREKIVVPYILSKENRYFKKMSPKNMGIERSKIEITNFSILTKKMCNEKISVLENRKYKYKTKFREYLAVEGTLINNSDVSLQNIRVDVIFLDEQDNIIDLNSNIVKNLPPGESGKFIVSSPYISKIHRWLFQVICI
jgi:hypothetical protein